MNNNYYNIVINNVRWYYKLIPKGDRRGLFTDYPRENLGKQLIVSMSYYDERFFKVRFMFAYFKSYIEYAVFMNKIPVAKRAFYEIILGEKPQKPHFDVDIEYNENEVAIDGEAIKDSLVENIINVLANKNVKISMNDVLIYTSHGKKKGEVQDINKLSYHIIVNNHCHSNNIEAKAFCQLVIENIPEEYKKYIDPKVYSPTQQFRIVGTTKIGKNRYKTFQKTWFYKGQEIIHKYLEEPEDEIHEMIMQLEESIIGFIGNCSYLPAFQPIEKQVIYQDTDDVTLNEAKEAFNLIGMASNISISDSRFPYKFEGIQGPIIMLRRIKPSNCRLCRRIHEHENPYLLVIGDERSVYFCCRRSNNNAKLFLGKLEPNETKPIINAVQELVQRNWTSDVLKRLKTVSESNSLVTPVVKPVTSSTIVNQDHANAFSRSFALNH